MPISEALLEPRGLREAAAPPPASEPRSATIIAAGRLRAAVPLRLEDLTPGDARSPLSAGADAARGVGPIFQRFDEAGARGRARQADVRAARTYEDGLRDGRRDGLAEGLRQGREALAAEIAAQQAGAARDARASLLRRVAELDSALADGFRAVERQTADDVIALALQVARKIVDVELARVPESIVGVVRQAIADLPDEPGRVRIALHPADHALIGQVPATQPFERTVELRPDPGIRPGGCLVETVGRRIDATVETRWRRTLAAIGRDEGGGLLCDGEDPA